MRRFWRRSGRIGAALAVAGLVAGCTIDASVDLPYADDFSGECAWPEETGALRSECADGGYRIVVEDANDAEAGSALLLEQATSSVAVKARGGVRKRAPASDDDYLAFGVSCVVDRDGTVGYAFVVTDDGEWAILGSRDKDQPRVLREGTTGGGRSGPHTVGGMCADAGGGRTVLAIEIDGETVAAVEDADGYARFEGFALTVASSRAGAEVRFDDVRARVPGPSDVEAAREDADVLLEDDFSDPGSGWAAASDEARLLTYERGGYRVRTKTSEPTWSLMPVEPATEAVLVESHAAYVGGPAEVGYGVVCYSDGDEEEGYVFTVSPSGGYAIFRETRRDIRTVADGALPRRNLGGGARVGAACVGGADETGLALFVDGEKVASAQDDAGVGRFGIVGVYAHTERGGADVLFDDFRAEQLDRDEVEAIRDGDAP